MASTSSFDDLFHRAVSAIDTGDAATLQQLLRAHPELVRERLQQPGHWLREQPGDALNGFFKAPYLIWFVAEDAVRNNTLPGNITHITHIIINVLKREQVISLQEQLNYTLMLVARSAVAQKCRVQLPLLDVLIDAGADCTGAPDNALVNNHEEAAAHLVKRGAPLTLASALCLGYWQQAEELASTADANTKQFVLVLCALNGKAKAIVWLLPYGVQVNSLCPDLYGHGTPLHHAVCSGSLETVKVLIADGAAPTIRDSAWQGTALGWAEYEQQHEIAAYLSSL
jgi:Ankyrin repeat.